MKHQNITITNYHPHGFAFGFEESNNEQVFIPINVAKGHNLEPGVKIFAHIAPNFADKSQRGTPWQAIRLHNAEVQEDQPPEADLPQEKTLRSNVDAAVLSFIQSGGYVTTTEIANYLEIENKAAGNSAQRNFIAGHIARADVYGRVGLKRPNFVLWAGHFSKFVEVQ
tara:strand:- start:1738 stop:2241 length:504 start_codon:yes stop_codon:yes gene_type:complete